MCNCRKNKSTPATKYVVTYPGGGTETKTSEIAAELAAGKVPGARYAPQTA